MSPLSTSPVYSSPATSVSSSPFSPAQSLIKKQKMSITQTYYLAHKARAKLSHEAAMPDHNLRLLVGHANLLDSLMLELADAEREQESWFNQSVRSASPEPAALRDERHIQWADSIAEEEEEEEDYYDESSSSEEYDEEDDEDDFSDEDVEMMDAVSLRRVPSHHMKMPPASPHMAVVEIEMDDDEEEDDYEDEDYTQLTLTRTPSHHSSSSSPPPELEHDLDESSEDEAMPPSPPSTLLATFAQRQQSTLQQQHQQQQQPQKQKVSDSLQTTEFYDDEADETTTIHHHHHYMNMPARSPARLVSAISVY